MGDLILSRSLGQPTFSMGCGAQSGLCVHCEALDTQQHRQGDFCRVGHRIRDNMEDFGGAEGDVVCRRLGVFGALDSQVRLFLAAEPLNGRD